MTEPKPDYRATTAPETALHVNIFQADETIIAPGDTVKTGITSQSADHWPMFTDAERKRIRRCVKYDSDIRTAHVVVPLMPQREHRDAIIIAKMAEMLGLE